MERDKLKQQRLDEMIALVELWANINTHTSNLEGIQKLIEEIQKSFEVLQPDSQEIVTFTNSMALVIRKRAQADFQIFLGGHVDTVFSFDHTFQKTTRLSPDTLQGPGVTDMKGGIVILLKALEQFEQTAESKKVGWVVVLNSDEEIGSPETTPLIESCAKICNVGLLFEPSFEDGSLVSSRKGSANFRAISKGKSAHAGRHPEKGINAIYPLARFITEAQHLNREGVLLNVGILKGGKAINIIPDYAECGLTIRCDTLQLQKQTHEQLELLANKEQLELIQTSFRPPKPFDAPTEALFNQFKNAAKKLGVSIQWKPSGGTCDGSTVAALGIPTIDTLGASGGLIHTDQEYLDLNSLVEKVDLTAHFLKKIAQERSSA